MKYSILMGLFFFAILGCNRGLSDTHKSDICQEYYALIKDTWIPDDGYYRLKGITIYEREDENISKLFNGRCLNGLPIKQARKIFGEPNTIEDGYLYRGKNYKYCLSPDCTRNMSLYTDSLGIVREMLTNRVIYEQD